MKQASVRAGGGADKTVLAATTAPYGPDNTTAVPAGGVTDEADGERVWAGAMFFAMGVLIAGHRARNRRGMGDGADENNSTVAHGMPLVGVTEDVLSAGAHAVARRG